MVITADLQKMYHQVLVHSNDRNCQRILWRFSLQEPVKEYQLNTVTYGQACTPYLAIRCLRQLATEGSGRYPFAARALLNDTYVDDIITGADTIDDARNLRKQLVALLSDGKFKAHKWCSNSDDILKEIPSELRECNANSSIDSNDMVKTLGLEWNHTLDEFRFTIQTTSNVYTKREMLSAISKLYDPLGIIGPVLTTAKILMQKLWEIKVNWDDRLPKEILDKWKEFQTSLVDVNTLRVPRLIVGSSGDNVISMHGFCDASENAYGACLYIQSLDASSGKMTVNLLCSKARVAPLRRQSIPRLELCSALLLAKLINSVRRAIHISIKEIWAWSDSMVVLYWLHGDISRWKPFISNRAADIIDVLLAYHWKHVKRSENPADLISRGATPARLLNDHVWWHGPKWLSDHRFETPEKEAQCQLKSDDLTYADSETKKNVRICNLNLQQSAMDDVIHNLIQNCSTLTKIERTVAYCFRFISNSRRKSEERVLDGLTIRELTRAQNTLIKYSQNSFFKEDIFHLQKQGQVKPTSKLLQLQAFLDKDGIIRVDGRLQEAP